MSITHRFKNRFIKDNLITSDTKSIGDFEKTVNELYNDNSSYGNRGWAFEVFTEAYLKHIRMENEVYVYDSIPYDIRKKLGLTTKDLGVDGIFKQNGEWASYQCKFRGQRDIIPFEDISTFFASSENFKYRYVITNSNQIGKNAQHIQRVSTIGHFDFDKLTPDDFQKILKAIRGKRVSYKPYTPLDHQIQGINAAKKYFKNNDRGQYNWACGTGKTLGAMFTADKLNAKSIIVYVPSLMLATQFRDDWLDSHTEFSKDLKFVFVASDKDLGKRDSYSDFSYPVTTDVDELQSLINNFERNNERYVIISTYQSSHVVVALKNHKIDFAVYDEAHRLAGKKQSKFANALKTKAHKHLFMTATPRIIKSKTKDAEKHIVSMDNKKVFGDVINEITFAKAKELKLVTDLKLMIVVIDKKLDEQELRESTTMLDGEEIRSEQVACQVALKKAYKKIQEPVKKIITFHRTIKGAHDFVKFGMNKIIPNLNFYETISSEIPTLQRQELIERYRESKTAIISNARCLGEGTNVKSINIGMFVDPKQSTIDIIQNVGRLIRTTNEYKKDHGYVIIPLFVDSDKFKDGEILNEDEIEHTNYRSLLKIMEAMMSMDKTIFDKAEYEGDGISTNKKSIRGVLRRILKDDVEIIGPSLNLNEIENSIDTIFVERFVGFMPFNEARDIVHGLKLKSVNEWKQHCKSGNRNKYIPYDPNRTYKDEWKGYGDWLGTGRIADRFKVYRPFEKARKFARSLKLKSQKEWRQYCKSGKKPDDIPAAPNRTYKDEWKGMGDWLGKK